MHSKLLVTAVTLTSLILAACGGGGGGGSSSSSSRPVSTPVSKPATPSSGSGSTSTPKNSGNTNVSGNTNNSGNSSANNSGNSSANNSGNSSANNSGATTPAETPKSGSNDNAQTKPNPDTPAAETTPQEPPKPPKRDDGTEFFGTFYRGVGENISSADKARLSRLTKAHAESATRIDAELLSGDFEELGSYAYPKQNMALPSNLGAQGKYDGFDSWKAEAHQPRPLWADEQDAWKLINQDYSSGAALKQNLSTYYLDSKGNSSLNHARLLNELTYHGLAPIFNKEVLPSIKANSDAENYFDAVKADSNLARCFTNSNYQDENLCTPNGFGVNLTVVSNGFANQDIANTGRKSTSQPTKSDPTSTFDNDHHHFLENRIGGFKLLDLQPLSSSLVTKNGSVTAGYNSAARILAKRTAGGIAPYVNFSYGLASTGDSATKSEPLFTLSRLVLRGGYKLGNSIALPDIVSNSYRSTKDLTQAQKDNIDSLLKDKWEAEYQGTLDTNGRRDTALTSAFVNLGKLRELAPLLIFSTGYDNALERKISYYQGQQPTLTAKLTRDNSAIARISADPQFADFTLFVTSGSPDKDFKLERFIERMDADIEANPQDAERLKRDYSWFKYSLSSLHEEVPEDNPQAKWRTFLGTRLTKSFQGDFEPRSNYHVWKDFVHNPYSLTCGDRKFDCVTATYESYMPYYLDRLIRRDELKFIKFTEPQVAADIVAGVAALVKEQFPWMTAHNLKTTLTTTATDLGVTGVDEVFGWGLVNAAKAVRGPAEFTEGDFIADLRLAHRSGGWSRVPNVVDVRRDAELHPDAVAGRYYFRNSIDGFGGLQVFGVNTTSLYLLGRNGYRGKTVVDSGKLVVQAPIRALGTAALNSTERNSQFAQVLGEHPSNTNPVQVDLDVFTANISNVEVGPNAHFRLDQASAGSVTSAGVTSFKNALLHGNFKLIARTDKDAAALARTRRIGFGEPTVTLELTSEQDVTKHGIFVNPRAELTQEIIDYLHTIGADFARTTVQKVKASSGNLDFIFAAGGQYFPNDPAPDFALYTKPALSIDGKLVLDKDHKLNIKLPAGAINNRDWYVARWKQLDNPANSTWVVNNGVVSYQVNRELYDQGIFLIRTQLRSSRSLADEIALTAENAVTNTNATVASETNTQAALAGTNLLTSLLEANEEVALQAASNDTQNLSTTQKSQLEPAAVMAAATAIVNNDDLSKLAYRSAATAYSSTQTTLSQQTRLAARDLFATAADLEANQAHAGLEPNLVQGLTSQAYVKHAQQRSSWEYDKGVLFGKWNHSTTTAGYLANLALADFNLKLGAGLSYTTGDWSEQFKAEQVNNQNNALNPHNGASVNSSTTDKQVADVQTSALSALVNLGASYKGGFANLGLGYSSQGLEASRAVLAKDDLKGSLKRKQYLVDATAGYKLVLPSASLTASAGVTSVTTTTAAFKETAVSQDVAVQAFAGDFKDSSKTLWFVHADIKTKVNFDLVALVAGAANASAGTGATNHSGLDLGASFEYALSGAKQTLTNGNLETGAVFDPKLVQVYSLGYTQSFGLVDLRLGAQYERNENWHNLEANAKLAVNF